MGVIQCGVVHKTLQPLLGHGFIMMHVRAIVKTRSPFSAYFPGFAAVRLTKKTIYYIMYEKRIAAHHTFVLRALAGGRALFVCLKAIFF